MSLVLDASAAIAWVYGEISEADMDQLYDELSRSGAAVPQIWYLEIANLLILNCRRGKHDFSFVERRFADLAVFEMKADETHRHAWKAVTQLAAKHTLTSYDAAYLELAQRLRSPLATLDKALIRAAEAEAVPLFWTGSFATN